MSDIARRNATLSTEKRDRLNRRGKTRNNTFKSFPLSPAQQRLWLLDQFEPGNPSYNIATSWRLHGFLNIEILEHSLNTIVQRHGVLRATFVATQEQPAQVIAPQLALTIPVVDLTTLTINKEREAETQRQIAFEAQRSFDLAQGPLIRAVLLRLSNIDHILLITLHHIIADGWSVGIFAQELTILYTSFLSNGASNIAEQLPELPIQYSDYAIWQRNLLESGEFDEQIEYWKHQLKDAPALLELPADYPRPATQTYRGNTETLMLPPSLARELQRLSHKEGATLFMVLVTMYTILLSRYTGQEDIIVGAPFANRQQAEVEGLIGFFLSTLLLRTDLSGNPTFRELLGRVRGVCLDAYEHLDVPFDHLIEVLNPERHLSHNPLFQVFFNLINLDNLPTRTIEWPGLSVEFSLPLEETAKFDLAFYAQEIKDGIQFQVVYNADIFTPARMQELLAQFGQLAVQIIAHPEEHIDQFSLVTPQARAVLPDPTDSLSAAWEGAVSTLLAQQAERNPDRTAAIDDHGRWSYRELNARCNQLANYLLAHSIESQDVVAIYAQRNVPLIWAILGTLKAGAAYLILDPAYPVLRLVEYIQQAKIRGFIQLEAAGSLPGTLEEALADIACRIQLPDLKAANTYDPLARYSPAEPQIAIGPDNLACISFTSGSTGRPKGILQLHGSLSHFLPLQQQAFELTADDRYSMLSGLAHDPLQRDIFTPLCLGATVCVPTAEGITAPGWLAEWMRQERISIATLTPPMLRLLTRSASADARIPSLRWAFIVGDMLTRHDVSELQRLAPSVTCVNMYGTTETQRASGYYIVPDKGDARDESSAMRRVDLPTKEIIPVGRCLKDAQLLVFNRSQRLAGISERGEICFRSPHLARGYLTDDELTQARFITNPFTQVSNDRIYRTGDLGRYRPDGTIDYLGRNDYQVKIRGFRIELGEIEATLRLHPALQEVVVIDREIARSESRSPASQVSAKQEPDLQDKILIAYVVPAQAQTDITLLRQQLVQFLRARLPNYMVPSVYIVLDALPLLPNRKVDRDALPPPAPGNVSETAVDEAPRTATEELLAQLCAEVLGLEQVGVHDNFFAIGGHSLLATHLIALIAETFKVTLPLRALFEAPTIASLALLLEEHNTQDAAPHQQPTALLVRGARYSGLTRRTTPSR